MSRSSTSPLWFLFSFALGRGHSLSTAASVYHLLLQQTICIDNFKHPSAFFTVAASCHIAHPSNKQSSSLLTTRTPCSLPDPTLPTQCQLSTKIQGEHPGHRRGFLNHTLGRSSSTDECFAGSIGKNIMETFGTGHGSRPWGPLVLGTKDLGVECWC
ncbi:unnamed protein product [Periconia digitata]|uniref:Secreted protein n=1 Tax=Periconia digitata TaxID=1303443 RepID=A0A9W4U7T7_9PLEO|nr:unnamed protein product [Periconia digitata]